ncbi:MAG TPA: DUF2235 domain-containing protein, partial [Dehalococcoidia bacterium]|nr:DUF2235 domain-containing protein [Dehalococcoidia bacterium]
IHNYIEGDELYFFGFSRGAYTVRSTAGMIRKVGLLDKVEADRAMEAWRIYREHAGGPDSQRAIAFREAFSRYPVRIRFLGVWDTVGALGIPGALSFIGRRRFQFHDVSLSRSVDYAYQALAIDERRRFFRPAVWKQHPEARGQVLEQAWFPGAHMDVGGGHRDHRLADAALIWIADGARAAGLALNDAYMEQIADADPLGRIHESRKSFYRLIPAYDRPIGTGGDDEPDEAVRSNERLHSAAEKRYELDSRYRPRGLVDYLARLGKRLAGGPGGGEPGGD